MIDAPATQIRSGPDAQTVPAAPERPGLPYRFEMVYAGGARRAYADSSASLIDVLYPGYLMTGDTDRWVARIALAIRAQVALQAAVNTEHDLASLPQQQYALLQGPRHIPPTPRVWNCPVPLILVDTYYEPTGPIPVPMANLNGDEPNLLWIRPSDDYSLLCSLHDLGAISLHELGDKLLDAHQDQEN